MLNIDSWVGATSLHRDDSLKASFSFTKPANLEPPQDQNRRLAQRGELVSWNTSLSKHFLNQLDDVEEGLPVWFWVCKTKPEEQSSFLIRVSPCNVTGDLDCVKLA
jgi:hypothetical protein